MQITLQHSIITQAILWFSNFHKSNEEINNEHKLVISAQNNPKNFAPIYDQYFEQIFVFINKRVINESTTSELTSEVFYKALYNIHKYKFKGLPFSAWLYRIASNIVAEHYRKQKKEPRHISVDSAHLIHLVSEITDENNFEKQQQLLISILSKLKEKEIQLIELRFFEDYSFKKIGDILGLTENNAKVKTFRVIKKMQKMTL